MKRKLMGLGEHLVKIDQLQIGLSEVKRTKYFLLTYINADFYISQRIYEGGFAIGLVTKLFEVVDLIFAPDEEWLPQFQQLVGQYLIINVVQEYADTGNQFLDVQKFYPVSKRFECYTEELEANVLEAEDGEYDERLEDYKFYQYVEDGTLTRIPYKRLYFDSIEKGVKYAINKYNDMSLDMTYPSRKVCLLFSVKKFAQRKEALLVECYASKLRYANGLVQLNSTIKESFVVRHGYDDDRNPFTYSLTFSTRQAAINFKGVFDDNNVDREEVARLSDVYVESDYYSDDFVYDSEEFDDQFDYTNIDYMPVKSDNQDLIDSAFEGDPEWLWNID
ncbi:MAG: hypothetical protein ABJ004_06345 [Cyclobacteriaceae bacterium]